MSKAWPPDDVKGSAQDPECTRLCVFGCSVDQCVQRPHLLWTVPTGSFCGGGWEACEGSRAVKQSDTTGTQATSLLWVPSTGHTGRAELSLVVLKGATGL